jgi:hypothetical protein
VSAKPPKLASAKDLIADELEKEAAAMRSWAADLRRAELAADWKAVAATRADLARFALDLDELAERTRGGPP